MANEFDVAKNRIVDDFFRLVRVDVRICQKRRDDFERIKSSLISRWASEGVFDGKLSKEQIRTAVNEGSLPSGLEIHHIIPLTFGGLNNDDNLCVLYHQDHNMVHAFYNSLKNYPAISGNGEYLEAPAFGLEGKTFYTKTPDKLLTYTYGVRSFAWLLATKPKSFDLEQLFGKATAGRLNAALTYDEEKVKSFYHQKRDKNRTSRKNQRIQRSQQVISVREAFELSQAVGIPIKPRALRQDAFNLIFAKLENDSRQASL